jgi:hypothetical protein
MVLHGTDGYCESKVGVQPAIDFLYRRLTQRQPIRSFCRYNRRKQICAQRLLLKAQEITDGENWEF